MTTGSHLAWVYSDDLLVSTVLYIQMLDASRVAQIEGTVMGKYITLLQKTLKLSYVLNLYNQLDESCNIYITRVEDFPGIYLVGRSFLEFIQIFGCGNGSYGSLPEWTQPCVEDLTETFTPTGSPAF